MRTSLLASFLLVSAVACDGPGAQDKPGPHTGDTDTDAVDTDRDDTDSIDTDAIDTDTVVNVDTSGDDDSDLPIDETDTDSDDTDSDGTDSDDTDDTDTEDTDTLGGDTDDTDTLGGDTDDTDALGGDTDDTGTQGGDTDDTDPDPWTHDTGWWWDTSVFTPGDDSCLPEDLPLGWVFGGTPGRDWVVTAYPDQDPAPMLTADWTGAVGMFAKTTDGATGLDVDVPNLRWMDNGFVVLAMADGYVVHVEDGNEDRNTACSGDPNGVVIRHDNGFVSITTHLKKNSLRVRRGDRVSAGSPIGVVGSSGCTTHPRVHVELLDCDGTRLDPFALEMFTSPPAYVTPLVLMDTHVLDHEILNAVELSDPEPDAPIVEANKTTVIAVMASGGQPGDTITVELWRPDGVLFETVGVTLSRELQRHPWWWNRKLGDWRGDWNIVFKINGVPVADRTVFVDAQVIALGVAEADFDDVLDQHRAMGVVPVWIDVYAVRGAWFYNLVSDPGAEDREVWFGLDATGHDARVQDALDRGDRVLHVDAAMSGSVTRFAGLAGPGPGAFETTTDLTNAQHWASYVDFQANDLRPVALSATGDTFEPHWTALWDDLDVGTYLTLTDVPRPDFYTMHVNQRNAGRYLSSLDARVVGGEPYLVGVWDERDRGRWSLKTLLEPPDFQTTHDTNRMVSLRLRAVVGYERFGGHRYAAWWTER